jgi:hypothetical protein
MRPGSIERQSTKLRCFAVGIDFEYDISPSQIQFPCMRVTEVFTPGSLPEHTYNSREDLRLEWRLLEARDKGHYLLGFGSIEVGKNGIVRVSGR